MSRDLIEWAVGQTKSTALRVMLIIECLLLIMNSAVGQKAPFENRFDTQLGKRLHEVGIDVHIINTDEGWRFLKLSVSNSDPTFDAKLDMQRELKVSWEF